MGKKGTNPRNPQNELPGNGKEQKVVATRIEGLVETINKSWLIFSETGKIFLHLWECLFILITNKHILPPLTHVLPYSINTVTERRSACSVKYYARK